MQLVNVDDMMVLPWVNDWTQSRVSYVLHSERLEFGFP